MRLLALRCGDLRTDAGLLLDGRPSGTMFDVPVMTHAIDTGDGVLVWDTGMHERCFADLGGYLGPLMAQAFEPIGGAESLSLGPRGASRLHGGRHPVGGQLPPALRPLRRQPPLPGRLVGGPDARAGVLPVEGRQSRVRPRHRRPRSGAAARLRLRRDARPHRRRVARAAGHPRSHAWTPVTPRDLRRRSPVRAGGRRGLHPRSHRDRSARRDRRGTVRLASAALAHLRALEADGVRLLLAHDPASWLDVADVADIHTA